MFYVFTKDIVARITKRFSSFQNNKTIGILAQSTYAIYLWHILVQDLLVLYLVGNISTIIGCFLICVMTFFICTSVFNIYNCILELLKG